jgi:hypothetical protein
MTDVIKCRVDHGKVKVLDARGKLIRFVGELHAKVAKLRGNLIEISYCNGITKIYDTRGHLKRSF